MLLRGATELLTCHCEGQSPEAISVHAVSAILQRDCFAEFILSNARRFFATLRLTESEGLAMTMKEPLNDGSCGGILNELRIEQPAKRKEVVDFCTGLLVFALVLTLKIK